MSPITPHNYKVVVRAQTYLRSKDSLLITDNIKETKNHN